MKGTKGDGAWDYAMAANTKQAWKLHIQELLDDGECLLTNLGWSREGGGQPTKRTSLAGVGVPYKGECNANMLG